MPRERFPTLTSTGVASRSCRQALVPSDTQISDTSLRPILAFRITATFDTSTHDRQRVAARTQLRRKQKGSSERQLTHSYSFSASSIPTDLRVVASHQPYTCFSISPLSCDGNTVSATDSIVSLCSILFACSSPYLSLSIRDCCVVFLFFPLPGHIQYIDYIHLFLGKKTPRNTLFQSHSTVSPTRDLRIQRTRSAIRLRNYPKLETRHECDET